MRVTHSVMTGWDKIVSIEHLQIHAAVVVVVMKDVTTLLQTPLHETYSQSKTIMRGFSSVKDPRIHWGRWSLSEVGCTSDLSWERCSAGTSWSVILHPTIRPWPHWWIQTGINRALGDSVHPSHSIYSAQNAALSTRNKHNGLGSCAGTEQMGWVTSGLLDHPDWCPKTAHNIAFEG